MRGIRALRAGRQVAAAIVADVHSHFVRAQETRVLHATLRRCRCLGRCSIYDYCSSVLDALAGQVPGVPDLVGSQYSTVSQHRLSWLVGLGCLARSRGREHTLTYGRRRMAFLLGLSSCNSNPPLHARRLVSNLIGEWNKDGERAKEDERGGRTDGRTVEPLHKFPRQSDRSTSRFASRSDYFDCLLRCCIF